MSNQTRIAILGAGPAGLFMYKRLVESGLTGIIIDIFERKKVLGAGMPYSVQGANDEHITNVSGNEIPEIVTPVEDWIRTSSNSMISRFRITPDNFNDYKVLPRLLFGEYLSGQFDLLLRQAKETGVETVVHTGCTITDIHDKPRQDEVWLKNEEGRLFKFDKVIICTGHNWPEKTEGKVPGYFDSPYPPSKLQFRSDHAVAIRGSSLTAIDAVRTLSRQNGHFREEDGRLSYVLSPDSSDFRIVLHSVGGLLPAIRFHFEDLHMSHEHLLGEDEIRQHIENNGGFLSLDFMFEENFKARLREKDPEFFGQVKNMKMEEFVEAMMSLREKLDPFQLFKAEYAEAERSIRRKQPVYWKEMLSDLSFALNYPAKYMSAEDMLRLRETLSPLISVVIAFVPQGSARELLALYEAGVISIVPVSKDSRVEPVDKGGIHYHFKDENGQERSVYYRTFVDCVGQPLIAYEDFPFRGLVEDRTVQPAYLRFLSRAEGKKAEDSGSEVKVDENGNYYLKVPGIAINDSFQVADQYGAMNERIYVMAVPYIGGYNPDYSGLDFCEAASDKVMESIRKGAGG